MSYATFVSDLDGPETETEGARDFSHPSREAPSPTQPPVQWVPSVFIGAKADRTELTSCCSLAWRLERESY